MKITKEMIGVHILAFLVARCGLLHMYPFAVSFFLSAYLQGRSSGMLLSILFLGIATNGSVAVVFKYGMILFCMLLVLKTTVNSEISENCTHMAIAGAIITTAFGVPFHYILSGEINSILFALLEGIIVASGIFVFEKMFLVLRTHMKLNDMDNEKIISMGIALGLALFGIPEFTGVFAMTFMVASFITLYATYCFGMGNGLAVSAVCGMIMAIKLNNVELLGAFILIGIVCATAREVGRIGSMIAYISAIILIGIFYCHQLLEADILRGAMGALSVFLIFPTRFMKKLELVRMEDDMRQVDSVARVAVQSQLRDFGMAFKKMEKVFSERCDFDTEIPDDLNNMYLSGDGISLLNAIESESNRLLEARRAFVKQIGQIGDIITSFDLQAEKGSELSVTEEIKIKEAFQRKNVRVRQAFSTLAHDNKISLYIDAKTVKGKIMTTKEAAQVLSKVLGKNISVSLDTKTIIGRDYTTLHFIEQANFKYLTGIRRITKDGEVVSGDNFSVTPLNNGQVMIMLSDGMGSGDDAYTQSERVVELLEQLIEAGFAKELAIKLINSLVSFMTGGNTFTTLDLCMLDLYSGMGDFIKLGASTTFVKRGEWIETIKSNTLPIGVLEAVELDISSKKLFDGDMIVMISDGALDGVIFENKEEYLKELILKIETNNPQTMVDEILTNISGMNSNRMKDDASVLAIGLWKQG